MCFSIVFDKYTVISIGCISEYDANMLFFDFIWIHLYELFNLIHSGTQAYAKNLSFSADYQNIRTENIAQHFTNVIEYNFVWIIIV